MFAAVSGRFPISRTKQELEGVDLEEQSTWHQKAKATESGFKSVSPDEANCSPQMYIFQMSRDHILKSSMPAFLLVLTQIYMCAVLAKENACCKKAENQIRYPILFFPQEICVSSLTSLYKKQSLLHKSSHCFFRDNAFLNIKDVSFVFVNKVHEKNNYTTKQHCFCSFWFLSQWGILGNNWHKFRTSFISPLFYLFLSLT